MHLPSLQRSHTAHSTQQTQWHSSHCCSLPMPAGMLGAHGTVWESAGNERALCLGAVKGACLPGAPPVLPREGPWPSEGSLHRWGLAS